jgi:hypothetical protein
LWICALPTSYTLRLPCRRREGFIDSFGNRCYRFVAPKGALRLTNSTLFYNSGVPDLVSPDAREVPIQELPPEVLRYLYNSRYCEVDRFSVIAFGPVWRSAFRMVAGASDLRLGTLKS